MARDVKINVTAQNGASRTFLAIGNDADRMGQKVQQSGRISAESLKAWNDAARAVGATIGTLSLVSSKAYGEAQASNARLAQSFENVGLSVDDFSTQLDKLGDTANRLAFDDEDLQDSLAELVTVTKDADQAFNDLAIAQDIARARNIDIEAATRLVIAAETGRYQSLQRVGIQIDATASKQEVLAQLQQQYAGQAEAYAQTGAASWERLGNTIENQLESLGAFTSKYQGVILLLSGTATAAGPAIDAFSKIGEAAQSSALVSTVLASSWAGPAGLAIGAVGLAAGITYLITQMNKYEDAAEAAARSTLDLDNFFKSLAASLDPVNKRIIQELDSNLEQIITDAAQRQSDLDKLLTLQLGITNEGIDISTEAAAKLAAETTGLTVEQLKWIDGNKDLRVTIDEVNSSVNLFQRNLDRLNADQVEKVQDNIQSLFSKSNLDYEKASAAIQDLNRQLDAGLLTPEQYVQAISDLATNYGDLLRGMASDTEEASVRIVRGWGTMRLEIDQTTDSLRDAIGPHKELGHVVTDLSGYLDDASRDLSGLSGWMKTTTQNAEAAGQAVIDMFNALGQGDFAENALAAFTGNVSMTVGLDTRQAEASMENIFRIGAGNLKNIAQTSDGIQKWGDDLVNVQGTYGKIDDSLAKGLISQDRYNMAQRAYNRLSEDNARIQDLTTAIQAKQVPIIAKAVDYQADQLDKVNQMSGAQQTAALGFMDAGESAKFMSIQTQLAAAASGELGDKGKESMEAILQGAVAADPYLASMLEQMGLITTTDGEVHINWDQVQQADGGLGDLTKAMNDLIAILADIYDIKIDHGTADAASGVLGSIAQQMRDLDGTTATVYINRYEVGFTQDVGAATGGMMSFARGGMAHLAELGPELLQFPSGATGLAMTEGAYPLPNGTLVHTAASTRDQLSNGMSFAGATFNFYGVQDPDQFGRQMRSYASTMERR